MSQEEVTFKFNLLKTELKRINTTILLNLEILSFGSRDFVVILYFCTVRALRSLKFFRKIIFWVFVNPNYKKCGMSLALLYFEWSVKTELN